MEAWEMRAVFLGAAELIETDQSCCCCYAISGLEWGRAAETFFTDWFKPELHELRAGDYNAFWMDIGCTEDEARARRVFALCLAAAMAETESNSVIPSEPK